MEIKKGISQMAEYPNVEINYVVPMDGQMYYVLRDGELSNGAIIATLDPKRAINSNVVTDTIGVFAEDGSVLIDFDKKDIRKINDEFLLVVNSIPKSTEVVNALKNENDEISKTTMKDNATTIVDKMMIEMGITGEILFSDAYSEANIYKVDGVNKEIGVAASFIGKNDQNFYFHTNDVSSETTVVSIAEEEEAPAPVAGFEIPSEAGFSSIPSVEEEAPVVPEESQEDNADVVPETEDTTDSELDINQTIFGNFNPLEETSSVDVAPIEDTQPVIDTPVVEDQSEDENEMPTEISGDSNNDAVLDNVIAVMKKMIEETGKLNKRISELEEEIREKNEVISREESKKNTLNDLLDEANEVLDSID